MLALWISGYYIVASGWNEKDRIKHSIQMYWNSNLNNHFVYGSLAAYVMPPPSAPSNSWNHVNWKFERMRCVLVPSNGISALMEHCFTKAWAVPKDGKKESNRKFLFSISEMKPNRLDVVLGNISSIDTCLSGRFNEWDDQVKKWGAFVSAEWAFVNEESK